MVFSCLAATGLKQEPLQQALASGALVAIYQVLVPNTAEKTTLNATLNAMANSIALGQTVGVSKLTEALQPYAGFAVTTTLLTPNQQAALPEPPPAGYQVAVLAVGYPSASLTCDLGTLLAVVFGKVSMGGAIRLLDVLVPEGLTSRFGGASLGQEGLRKRLGVASGHPLLMSIFKPCLGQPVEKLAASIEQLSQAGCHLVKDDEVLSDPNLETAIERVQQCRQAVERSVKNGGFNTLHVLQLSGSAHELLPRAQALVNAGAEAFLFNYLIYGLPLLHSLRQCLPSHVALFAHPAMAGGFYGSPWHGVEPACLFGTLPRLAGADAVLFPSPYGKVCLPKAQALGIHQALSQPLPGLKPTFSVPSAGIKASMVPQLLNDFGHNVIVNAGTGIFEHEHGVQSAAHAFLSQFPIEASA